LGGAIVNTEGSGDETWEFFSLSGVRCDSIWVGCSPQSSWL
jgi:hypothetical protein